MSAISGAPRTQLSERVGHIVFTPSRPIRKRVTSARHHVIPKTLDIGTGRTTFLLSLPSTVLLTAEQAFGEFRSLNLGGL